MGVGFLYLYLSILLSRGKRLQGTTIANSTNIKGELEQLVEIIKCRKHYQHNKVTYESPISDGSRKLGLAFRITL